MNENCKKFQSFAFYDKNFVFFVFSIVEKNKKKVLRFDIN
jgi:hypothetical protein